MASTVVMGYGKLNKLTFGGAGPEAVNELAGKLTVLFIAPKAPDNLKVSQHLKLG